MENGTACIGEDVRKDKEGARKPKSETPAAIDLDNLKEFRPVPACFN